MKVKSRAARLIELDHVARAHHLERAGRQPLHAAQRQRQLYLVMEQRQRHRRVREHIVLGARAQPRVRRGRCRRRRSLAAEALDTAHGTRPLSAPAIPVGWFIQRCAASAAALRPCAPHAAVFDALLFPPIRYCQPAGVKKLLACLFSNSLKRQKCTSFTMVRPPQEATACVV